MSPRKRIPFIFILFVCVMAASLAGLTADARAAASGARLWAKIVTPAVTASTDMVLSVAPGPNGSVYACGVYDYPLFSGYLWVARYSSAGRLQWLRKYGESLGIDANANAMTVDKQGDPIVVGQAVVAGNTNALTLKYSPNGTLRWARQFDGAVSGQDFATAVAVDGAGGIYVAGATADVGTGLDYLVVKYDKSGHRRFVSTYSGPFGDDVVAAVAVGDAGSVYVTGHSQNASGIDDCETAKLSSSGPWKWFRRFASPGGFADYGQQIAASAGGVYVDGIAGSALDASGDDILLLKYSTGGSRPWARTWDGPAHLQDNGPGLAVDAAGNAWVAGWTFASASKERGLLIKWDAAGHRKWVQTYRHSGINDSEFNDVVVDSSGRAWCAGWQAGGARFERSSASGPRIFDDTHFVVAKYAASGSPAWARSWTSSHQTAMAQTLCLSGSGVYVGGWSTRPASGRDPALLKYKP